MEYTSIYQGERKNKSHHCHGNENRCHDNSQDRKNSGITSRLF